MLNLSCEIVWKFEATTWDSIVASCVHRLDSFDEWLGSCWWLQICHSARGSNPGPAKGKLNQSITNFIEILVNHLLLSFCSHHFSSSRQFLLQGSRSQSHLSAPRYMANSFPLYGLDRMYYDWEAWTKTKRLEHRVALTIFCDPGPHFGFDPPRILSVNRLENVHSQGNRENPRKDVIWSTNEKWTIAVLVQNSTTKKRFPCHVFVSKLFSSLLCLLEQQATHPHREDLSWQFTRTCNQNAAIMLFAKAEVKMCQVSNGCHLPFPVVSWSFHRSLESLAWHPPTRFPGCTWWWIHVFLW